MRGESGASPGSCHGSSHAHSFRHNSSSQHPLFQLQGSKRRLTRVVSRLSLFLGGTWARKPRRRCVADCTAILRQSMHHVVASLSVLFALVVFSSSREKNPMFHQGSQLVFHPSLLSLQGSVCPGRSTARPYQWHWLIQILKRPGCSRSYLSVSRTILRGRETQEIAQS